MNTNRENINETEKEGIGKKVLYWGLGGMIGGLVVGITIAGIYGWTLLSVSYWIGFGLLVGAMSGAISYVLLYHAIYGLILNKKD